MPSFRTSAGRMGERSASGVVFVALLRLFIAAVGPAATDGAGGAQWRVVLAGRSTAQTGWTLTSPTWAQSRPSARGEVELARPRPAGEQVRGTASDAGVLIGYARCSTDKQDLNARAICCVSSASAMTACISSRPDRLQSQPARTAADIGGRPRRRHARRPEARQARALGARRTSDRRLAGHQSSRWRGLAMFLATLSWRRLQCTSAARFQKSIRTRGRAAIARTTRASRERPDDDVDAWCFRISGLRVLARIAPIQPPGSTVVPVRPLKNPRPPSAPQPIRIAARLIRTPTPLPRDADAMFLEYKQRAGARRTGCGENARPTSVQGQFIPPWSQQAMVYPEVPVNERASAWLQT